jgi:hypothetical protein
MNDEGFTDPYSESGVDESVTEHDFTGSETKHSRVEMVSDHNPRALLKRESLRHLTVMCLQACQALYPKEF